MKDFSPSRIPIVGLTGGIGSGKSTVARLLERLGAAVWDSDARAKELYRASGELREAVAAEFGKEMLTWDAAGEHIDVDRTVLAARVFRDSLALDKLNHLVHPAVRVAFARWHEGLDADATPYVVREAAILFESGSHVDCDLIVTVEAPEEIRVARVVARDSASPEAVKQRMLRQWPSERRRAEADFVLENVDEAELEADVIDLHHELRGKLSTGS